MNKIARKDNNVTHLQINSILVINTTNMSSCKKQLCLHLTQSNTQFKIGKFTSIVMGNIGSGKSTLLKMIKDHYDSKIKTFPEPVDDWKYYLEYTLAHPNENNEVVLQVVINQWFYKLKHLILPKCTQSVVMERSALESRQIFGRLYQEDTKVNEMGVKLLDKQFLENQIEPDFYVYVNTSPKTCILRKIHRGRDYEKIGTVSEELKLWSRYDRYYKDLINNLQRNGKIVFIIDGEKNKESVFEAFKASVIKYFHK